MGISLFYAPNSIHLIVGCGMEHWDSSGLGLHILFIKRWSTIGQVCQY